MAQLEIGVYVFLGFFCILSSPKKHDLGMWGEVGENSWKENVASRDSVFNIDLKAHWFAVS